MRNWRGHYRIRNAYHESGHATVARVLGGRLIVVMSDAGAGSCNALMPESPEKRAALAIAGAVAVAMHDRRMDTGFSDEDRLGLLQAVAKGSDIHSVTRKAFALAHRILGENWPQVEELAMRLICGKVVGGGLAETIIDNIPCREVRHIIDVPKTRVVRRNLLLRKA